jgi:hypothetical protein
MAHLAPGHRSTGHRRGPPSEASTAGAPPATPSGVLEDGGALGFPGDLRPALTNQRCPGLTTGGIHRPLGKVPGTNEISRLHALVLVLGVVLALVSPGCRPASREAARPSAFFRVRPPSMPPGPRGEPQILEMLGRSVAAQFPLDHVEEEPKRFPLGSGTIVGAPDFAFVLGQGSGMNGFDTLTVDASGQATLVFEGVRGGPSRLARFRLSPPELEGLQRELAAVDLFGLKRGYFARVDDGTQWFVRVQAVRQRKTVVLDNHFPEPIVRLTLHVRDEVLAPHREAIDAAEPIESLDGLREPMRWSEDAPP